MHIMLDVSRLILWNLLSFGIHNFSGFCVFLEIITLLRGGEIEMWVMEKVLRKRERDGEIIDQFMVLHTK